MDGVRWTRGQDQRGQEEAAVSEEGGVGGAGQDRTDTAVGRGRGRWGREEGEGVGPARWLAADAASGSRAADEAGCWADPSRAVSNDRPTLTGSGTGGAGPYMYTTCQAACVALFQAALIPFIWAHTRKSGTDTFN